MEKVTTEREMGDNKRKNMMAVDLAIQRELAYREKVVMLGLEPYGDSRWKDFLPLQEPSSSLSPSVPKMKQEAPSSSSIQSLVPHPIVIPTPNSHLKPWASSRLCPRVTEMNKNTPISSLKNREDTFFCKVCQVPCSGLRNFKMHIRGRQHGAKVKELKLGRKDSGQKANKPQWCELCKISCIGENSLRLHLEGQKHMAKLQKLEGDGKAGGEEANQPQWCGLCKIWFMNESAFKQHLEGKKAHYHTPYF